METRYLITIAAVVALIGAAIGVGVRTHRKSKLKKSEYYYNRGVTSMEKGEGDPVSDFTKAIELNPRLAMAYVQRGLLTHGEATDQAIADYTKAIEIDPRWARPLRGACVCLLP